MKQIGEIFHIASISTNILASQQNMYFVYPAFCSAAVLFWLCNLFQVIVLSKKHSHLPINMLEKEKMTCPQTYSNILL